jgi:hypothetical protein
MASAVSRSVSMTRKALGLEEKDSSANTLSLSERKNTILNSHGRAPWYGQDGKRITDAFVIGVAGELCYFVYVDCGSRLQVVLPVERYTLLPSTVTNDIRSWFLPSTRPM